jgi:hypothetical protein
MPTKLETQIKAHWAKVVLAIAAAFITIITKTGDAVATRMSDLVFKTERQSIMFEECKKQDSVIKAIHSHDIALITLSIEEIKASNNELEKKIDMHIAKMDGYFNGLNLRFSDNDTTRPCNHIGKPCTETQITYYK